MRLGGPIFRHYSDPKSWAAAVKSHGYRAAYCPVDTTADDATIRAYADAAQAADIVIAEVGGWSNPISPNPDARPKALETCKSALALADKIGAACCVNLAGSRSASLEGWYDPHPANFSDETFQMIAESTREIIDAVQPTRTFFTLETMPWIFPESVDSYLRLIEAIDRPQFAVHLDAVNLLWSPRLLFSQSEVIRDCFARLGPYIKSCHIKDIALSSNFTVHLNEVRPGEGSFDYRTFLAEANKLSPGLPLMMEHLPIEEEYDLAAQYIRSIAQELKLAM